MYTILKFMMRVLYTKATQLHTRIRHGECLYMYSEIVNDHGNDNNFNVLLSEKNTVMYNYTNIIMIVII